MAYNIKRNEMLFCRDESYNYVALEESSVKDDFSVIHCPEDIVEYMKWMQKKDVEHLCVVPLDSANHALGYEIVSKGLVNQTPCNASQVFKTILSKRKYASCTSFIMLHNHPSGECNPSDDDMSLTRAMVAASCIMKMPMIDHIIIGKMIHGRSRYISLCRRYRSIFDKVYETIE